MNATLITARDLIALGLVPGAGRNAIHTAIRMARRDGQPMAALLGAPERKLLRRAAAGEESAALALHHCGPKELDGAAAVLSLCAACNFRVLNCLEPGYPTALATALGMQAPPLLFFQGNEALLDEPGAAIVGTRRPSREGAEWASRAARLFAEQGIPMISGGADGVDTEAHLAALAADGTTVVVLPEGLHAHLPHTAIRSGLQGGRTLLLSEFLPSDLWQTHRAMTRNRTIAALSRAVCVIEPREKGGSMFTAEQALLQGKSVFFWGGACRDGALRGRPGASPLIRHGRLDRRGLLDALAKAPATRDTQAELFPE